ncbi:MAG TPA: DUF4215 domain-containing protein, partial [Polyangiales bacterium]
NSNNTDACTNACTLPGGKCGNGSVDPGEQCDDANTVNTDSCTNACKSAVCGDSIVGPGEECDDANTVNTDACTNTCTNARCGDGIVGPGEQCDDTNTVNTDACTNACANARCGDGIVGPGEECDDGNSIDTDTCTNACKIFVSTLCGNGAPDPGEECDDGNKINTDACSNTCLSNICGNNRVDPGETCDGSAAGAVPFGLGQSCAADCLSVTDNCLACEVANCTDYLGAGVDLVAGCYHDPNPTFVQQCVDAVDCARTKNCAYTARGAEQCYCGSASSAQCQLGTGIDGACKTQFETAAGSSSAQVVTGHFGDRSLPIGNAVFMLQCDRDFCGARSASGAPTQCVP